MYGYMHAFLVALAYFTESLCSPACDPEKWNKCFEPAEQYFRQQYLESRPGNVSDEIWAKEMSDQCELNANSEVCQSAFIKHCPQGEHTASFRSAAEPKDPVSCQPQVKVITTGCAANFSQWYKHCVSTFLDHHTSSALTLSTMTKDDVHQQVCLETDRLAKCISDQAKTKCNEAAVAVFRTWSDQQLADFSCPSR